VKITIDTKEDSHEEIGKVLSLLQNLIAEKEGPSTPQRLNISQPVASMEPVPEPIDTGGMMNMFDTPAVQESVPQAAPEPTTVGPLPQTNPLSIVANTEQKDTGPDFTSFLDLAKQPEQKEDPQLEFF
jgi:hypothetical protein